MAIMRGAFGGGQIKGSIAGNTFQQSPYGTVIRNRTVPVNPNTAPQQAIRSAMGNVSYAWANILTQLQRDGWIAYAAETPVTDRFGEQVYLSGRAMYIRLNNARLYENLTILGAAPVTPGVAPAPSIVATLENDGVFTVTSFIPTPLAGDDFIIMRIGNPVSQARLFYKAPFTRLGVLNSASTPPDTFTVPLATDTSQRFFYALRYFADDGKVSQLVTGYLDVTAA